MSKSKLLIAAEGLREEKLVEAKTLALAGVIELREIIVQKLEAEIERLDVLASDIEYATTIEEAEKLCPRDVRKQERYV